MRKRDAERKREVRPTYATVTNEREATPPNVQSRVFANRRTTAHHRKHQGERIYCFVWGALRYRFASCGQARACRASRGCRPAPPGARSPHTRVVTLTCRRAPVRLLTNATRISLPRQPRPPASSPSCQRTKLVANREPRRSSRRARPRRNTQVVTEQRP